MVYNWRAGSVLSATLCFHSAFSAILWFQPHAAAPNATLKTNGFCDVRGQFMVPEAAKLWVRSHDYERSQSMSYNRRLHKSPLFRGLRSYGWRLPGFVTILAAINDRVRHHSWQNPTCLESPGAGLRRNGFRVNDFGGLALASALGRYSGSTRPSTGRTRQRSCETSAG